MKSPLLPTILPSYFTNVSTKCHLTVPELNPIWSSTPLHQKVCQANFDPIAAPFYSCFSQCLEWQHSNLNPPFTKAATASLSIVITSRR